MIELDFYLRQMCQHLLVLFVSLNIRSILLCSCSIFFSNFHAAQHDVVLLLGFLTVFKFTIILVT